MEPEIGRGAPRRRAARRGALAALAALALAALGAGVAWGADTIRASTTCCTFTANTYQMAAGEIPTFTNGTIGGIPHDVAATSKGPDGKFLFKSAVIGSNQSAPVRGTQYLSPGTYRFFCTVHGTGMAADLRVTGGDPVPRPRLAVSITSSDLGRVRSSGKLAVRLSDAGSTARGAVLTAKTGSTTIATKRGVTVPSGTIRNLVLSLTRAGRDALKGRQRATVVVKVTLAFAKPDTARKALD